MKSLYLLILFYIGLSLSGCAAPASSKTTQLSENTVKTIPSSLSNLSASSIALKPLSFNQRLEKNRFSIAMYTGGQHPADPYKILGTESISKFNGSGIKRQTANIYDVMRDMAAQMGGDAIINIANDDKTVTGTVITYEKQKTTV